MFAFPSDDKQTIISKKIVAARVHVAKCVSVDCMFGKATRAINSNSLFHTNIETRAVQEKFGKMIKEYKTKDWKKMASSGLQGEKSPKKSMLAGILEGNDG